MTQICASPARRLALYLPNTPRAVVWAAAAKRLGVPYVAVAGGTASSSLADRLVNVGAAFLVTSATQLAAATAAAKSMSKPPDLVLCDTAIAATTDNVAALTRYEASVLLAWARVELLKAKGAAP